MKYLLRGLKYLVKLCVLCVLIFALAFYTKSLDMNGAQTLEQLLVSRQGLQMLLAFIAISAVYPCYGYVKGEVKDADIQGNREQIINAFKVNGYVLQQEQGGKMTFVYSNILRRVMSIFEDTIIVEPMDGGGVRMDGSRKGVAYVIYRLSGYLSAANKGK